MKAIQVFIIFFLISAFAKASDGEYTKDIFSSAFIEFQDTNFRNIIMNQNIKKVDNNSLLFIYTPGSLNDDRMDGICSTYNEFAYLAEFFYNLKKNL